MVIETNRMPYTITRHQNNVQAIDIYTRMLENRIIFLDEAINTDVASSIIAQLLFLESEDREEDIYMYINSPGGAISDGLAIIDTMEMIAPDISTICVGMAANMSATILAAGTKGKRFALPNSEVMIHQPLGVGSGQASDIEIMAKHIIKTKKKMNQMLADYTGQKLKTIEKDTERDNFLTSEEALSYGIIDSIITKTSTIKNQKGKYNYEK